jgi:amino acid adenylation domain-containing protein
VVEWMISVASTRDRENKEMHRETINGFRLSPQQRRLWLLQRGSSAYLAQSALLIEGGLRPEVLKEAVYRIVRRHEILRTTFHSLPGMKLPVQVVAEESSPSSLPLWRDDDLSDRSAPEQAEKIEELFREDRRRPFDFGQGPLLRAVLLKFSVERHILFLSLPSICADAWTLKNLALEIGRFYEACLGDEAPSGEPMQYAQFSEWQNEVVEDEDAEAGREFWRKQTFSAPPAVELPFESERAGQNGFEPDSSILALDRGIAVGLEAVAERQGVPTEVFLLACWQTLLWRLTAQSGVVIGCAQDGRRHEVLQSALGLFAKWLPIGCRFEASFRFSEVLSQIAASKRAADEWQEYFVWGDDPAPELSADDLAPFFPIGFEFEERPRPYLAGGLSFSIRKQSSCAERFHLKLSCHRTGDLLMAEFHYDPGRFRREDVDRLAAQFDALLSCALERAEAPVCALEALSDADRRQLLVAFNDTDADYPKDKCVHQLFEEQAQRTPGNLAVIFSEPFGPEPFVEERLLTYAELNARANQLARYLRRMGVGPEAIVGLCLERSVEAVVGIFGILKAGAAYLPLDPTLPQERLAFMLAETQAAALLTQERLVERMGSGEWGVGSGGWRMSGSGSLLTVPHSLLPIPHSLFPARVVCLDADWDSIAQESEENLGGAPTSANLAYVIYTSGSTGKPKGVMIEHRSVVNLAHGLARTVYAGQGSPLRVSLNAPLTFDASVKQLLQLLYGHTLRILPETVRLDGSELLSYLNRHSLDVLDCTPAQLQLLLAAGFGSRPDAATKLALVGGEAVDDATWRSLVVNAETNFHNVYGPTECTVDATVCSVREAQEPVIGRPIANTKIFLLGERLDPVPIGVPGELYIGGDGLARGYLDGADLTAEKFIPNPFSATAGARLYKTGDLARYLSDGMIKFIGRTDHQVKLRGFRIELGEVEAVLKRGPDVQDGVVVVREDTPGDKRLVAYVVLARGRESSLSELRDFLKEKLPEYMIPSAIVRLNDLPLTRHGKVDRQSLPAPESERPELRAAYVAPRTRIEGTIAAIWQEVLRVEKVGVDDNFFDLGGHSLLMVQVHSKLREAFSKDISLIEMFRNPTVGSLARYFAGEEYQQPSLQKAHDRARKRRMARGRIEDRR